MKFKAHLILYKMLENFPLHRGHSAFTLLHSCRQVKQNLCMQESVMLLFSTWIKRGLGALQTLLLYLSKANRAG